MNNITDIKKSVWVKLAIAIGALFLFYMLAGLMFPVLMAIALSIAIHPLAKSIAKIKMGERQLPDIVVIILTFLVVGLLLYLFIAFLLIPLFKDVNGILRSIPLPSGEGATRMPDFMHSESVNALPSDIKEILGQAIQSASQSLMTVAKSLVASTFGVAASVLGLFIVPFLVFYFLKDWKILSNMFVNMFASNSRPLVYKIVQDLGQTMQGYVLGMMKMCVLAGLCIAAITSLVNAKYALLMGVLGAMMELVPFVGPVFCTITAVFLVYTAGPNLVPYIFFGYVAYYIFDSQVLFPHVMNKAVTIPSVVIILSVLMGGKVFGIMGLIFAVPVLCVAKVLYKYLWHMGEEQ